MALSTACPKPTPPVLLRHRRRVDSEARLAEAYTTVDLRDQSICWITGIFSTPGAVDPRKRREHHHLAGRRVKPEWKYDPDHIITVTGFVHDLLTAKALLLEGDDARKRIIPHWNRDIVAVGKEPFKLRSKRWSQNQ